MEARAWTGDDDRDCGPLTCQECGIELYPEEVKDKECRRCVGERAEAEADERGAA